MKKKLAYFLAALLVLISLFSVTAFADFGDYAGDSDWGWDSGSTDWGDSGSSWDWGSSDDYDDYGSGYIYDGSSGNSGSSGGGFGIAGVVVVVVIVLVVLSGMKGKGGKSTGGNRRVNIQQPRTAPLVNNIAGLKAKDPNFSEAKFLEDAANLYVRLQNAWTARDLEPIRSKLSEELYARSERQVQTYINNAQTNHVDRIAVLNSSIVGCTSDDTNDIITVQLTARVVDYTTDDNSGNVVRGDRNRELFMTYQWTYIRSLGKLTGAVEGVDDKHCPNCGAPIDLNRSAVCDYCGAVVKSGDYDWVVSNIKGISQQTQ